MSKKDLKTPPKITVRIWTEILKKFDPKIRDACLRRDAYLAKLLETELDHLDNEVGIPNSPEAYQFVAERLDELPRRLVSIALPVELSARLNEICAAKRVVRDAFFNRLFLLLAASPKTIDQLWFSYADVNWRTTVWSEFKHDGPFFERGFYPLESGVDPFWAIRCGMELFNEEAHGTEEYTEPTTGKTVRVHRAINGEPEPLANVYTIVFDRKYNDKKLGEVGLLGLSCHLPDWRIPGHEAEREHRSRLDELLEALS